MRRKKIVAFTGIDGSGKTTQAKLLFEILEKNNVRADFIRSKWEPTILRPLINRWKRRSSADITGVSNNDADGKKRKQRLLNIPLIRHLWLAAFFLDYGLQIFLKIRSRLFSSGLIISDRIYYDSIIDQAVNLGEKKSILLDKLDSFWMGIVFPKPDIVLYIDCPEDIAFSRKRDKYTPNIEYLTDRRRLYLELADRYSWVKINGTLPVEKIAADIKKRIYIELKL